MESITIEDSEEQLHSDSGESHTFSNYNDATAFITQYEEDNNVKFHIVRRHERMKANDVDSLSGSKVVFKDRAIKSSRADNQNCAFIVLGTELRECLHRRRYKKPKKSAGKNGQQEANTAEQETETTEANESSENVCLAQISLRNILYFPDFQIPAHDSKTEKSKVFRKLKSEFGPSIKRENKVLVTFIGEHTNHVEKKAVMPQPSAPLDLTDMPLCSSDTSFTFSSYDEAEAFISNYEDECGVKFVKISSSYKLTNQTDITSLGKQRIWFNCHSVKGPVIDMLPCPYVILATERRECIYGPNRVKKPNSSGEGPTNTKKMGCEATIFLKSVIVFTEYKRPSPDTKANRNKVLDKIRAQFESTKREFRVLMNFSSEHSNHVTGSAADFAQPLDPRVVKFIQERTVGGIHKVDEMIPLIGPFVVSLNAEGAGRVTNKRYYPARKTVYNIMYNKLKSISKPGACIKIGNSKKMPRPKRAKPGKKKAVAVSEDDNSLIEMSSWDDVEPQTSDGNQADARMAEESLQQTTQLVLEEVYEKLNQTGMEWVLMTCPSCPSELYHVGTALGQQFLQKRPDIVQDYLQFLLGT